MSGCGSRLFRGEYIDPTRSRIRDLGPKWLHRQTHLKPSSYRSQEIAWRVHVEPQWKSVKVCDVGHSAVQDWVAALGADKSATTVKRAMGVLSAILDESVRDWRILSNPCLRVETKRKTSREHVYLTHEQVQRLARESKGHELVILVLAYTGLRWAR